MHMKPLSTSTRRLRLSTVALLGSLAISALFSVALLFRGIGRIGSRHAWTSLGAFSSSSRIAQLGSADQEQAELETLERSRLASGLDASGGTRLGPGSAAVAGAIHHDRAVGDGRFNAVSPSEADTFLLAALERLERQVAEAMARARESVVALEYTAADAPDGTRRIATGIVINQRGEVLSVKIDPVTSGKAAGTGNRPAPIVARDHSGRRHVAQWIGADSETGLTLLQIAPRALRPIRMAIRRPNMGGPIFVLGNPFGMGQSVSRGHIAGLDWAMELADHQLGGMIQVQAPLYPGDSGAAVVNLRGDLLGVIRSGLAIPCSPSSARSRSVGSLGEGPPAFPPSGQPLTLSAANAAMRRLDHADQDNDFGFAISAGDALWVADQLRASGRVDRAYLGVRLEATSEDLPIASLPPATASNRMLANSQSSPTTAASDSPPDQPPESREGALLVEILAGTPAAESGLRAGDRIVSVDGQAIRSAHDLTDRLDRIPAHATIQLAVIRGPISRQQTVVLSLRTASRPVSQQLAHVDRGISQLAAVPSQTLTPNAPVNVIVASGSSQPAAMATRLAGHGVPARPSARVNSTPRENAAAVDGSASAARELRPNDLRLTLPRAVVERLEQLERRLEKLESPSPGAQALPAKQDTRIGSVKSP
jgi:S1-C subfamily serine protease